MYHCINLYVSRLHNDNVNTCKPGWGGRSSVQLLGGGGGGKGRAPSFANGI